MIQKTINVIRMKCFCGIDLAAKEKNPTGVVCINPKRKILEEGILFKDRDIIAFVRRNKPIVIAIDAPLSLPSEYEGKMRQEERILRKRGYNIFPFFKSMTELAKRGIRLYKKLQNEGYDIIEVHPSTSERILKIKNFLTKRKEERKEENREREGKKQKGIQRHIYDAFIAAKTALLYSEGKCECIAGVFYIPKESRKRKIERKS